MSREILVLWAGRRESGAWEELCGEYRRRMQHFLEIRDQAVRVPKVKDAKARLLRERQAFEGALPDKSWVIALDRRGRQYSSADFARRLEQLRQDWPHSVVFLLGSDLGLQEGLLQSARERISFGQMTLPHNLARLLLYEQLYRALSIGAGIKYHREPL